ncbi:MAG: hypothetical protein K1X56_02245 [Flavobacteriales bacterium]|nr:hypothetical protein [Flavobacteriales bacterium]
MAVQSASDIFCLVKSLSVAEKRHFVIYAGLYERESTKSYLRLFEMIEGMSEYDEDYLKARLSVSQFSVLKSRLYHLILKVLSTIGTEKSSDVELRSQLGQATFLSDRGMVDQALRLLDRVRIKAIESGRYEMALQSVRMAIPLVFSSEQLHELHTRENALIELTNNLSVFKSLYHQIEAVFRSRGTIRSMDELEDLEKIIRNPALLNYVEDASIENVYWYHLIHIRYYQLVSKLDFAYDHLTRLLLRMQLNLDLVNGDKVWINRMSSIKLIYLKICVQLDRVVECRFIIDELEEAELPYLDKVEYYAHLLNYYSRCSNFSEAEYAFGQAQKIIRRLDKGDLSPCFFPLVYQMARFLFIKGEYKKSAKYCELILREREACSTPSYFPAFQLQILSYFELGNNNLIIVQCKAYGRKLSTCAYSHKADSLFLSMIKKLVSPTRRFKEKVESQALNEFTKMLNDPFEVQSIMDSEIINWLLARISGQSVSEIIKEKALDAA